MPLCKASGYTETEQLSESKTAVTERHVTADPEPASPPRLLPAFGSATPRPEQE